MKIYANNQGYGDTKNKWLFQNDILVKLYAIQSYHTYLYEVPTAQNLFSA